MGKSGERGREGEPGIKVPMWLYFFFCLYVTKDIITFTNQYLKNMHDFINRLTFFQSCYISLQSYLYIVDFKKYCQFIMT